MTQFMRFLLFVFLLSGLVVGVGVAAGLPGDSMVNAGWEELGAGSATGGGISDNDGLSYAPALAIGPDGPVIAWTDGSNGDHEIYVRRWDGAAWVEIGPGSASGGGISANDGLSQIPSVAAGPDGPIVAWEDMSSGNIEIYVRRWDCLLYTSRCV